MLNRKMIIGVVVVVLLEVSVCCARYSGGTGSPGYPYRIATAEDLNDIGNHIEDFNKFFVMVYDIDLSGYTGMQFNVLGSISNPFTGVFDGDGHIISNFTYSTDSIDKLQVGLFNYINEPNAKIKDLTLVDPNVRVTGDSRWIYGVVLLLARYGLGRLPAVTSRVASSQDLQESVG